MSDDNVTVLGTKLERWLAAYECEDVCVKVSNRGRLLVRIKDEHVTLPCTDMLQLIQGMIRAMADHGFPAPPPEPNDPVFMKVR